MQERPDARRHARGRCAVAAHVGDDRRDGAARVLEDLEEIPARAEVGRLLRSDEQVGPERQVDGAAARDGGQLARRRRKHGEVNEV